MSLTVSDMNAIAAEVVKKKDEFNAALVQANAVGVLVEASLRWNHVMADAADPSMVFAPTPGKPTLSEIMVTCSLPLPLPVGG